MTDKNKIPERNAPKWAQQIIRLLETQNSRLEDISNQANQIAEASNKISKTSMVIAVVAIGVSVLAYLQIESQFAESVEVQKNLYYCKR